MYLTIKRKDSVTSILLFIFNVFLVERGMTVIPLKKIFQLLAPFQKNETAIRMGLSREIQNGLLINEKQGNEVIYRITDKVLEGFKYWMRAMDFNREKINLQLMDWDESWSILVQNDNAAKRDDLKGLYESLNHLSFGSLNKTTWISPYHVINQMGSLLQESQAEGDFNLFEGSLVMNGQDKGGRQEVIVAKIWPIAELTRRYRHYLDSINEVTCNPDILVSKSGDGLPILYRFGLDYFEIVQDDPRLPLQILPPNWPGIKAAQAFNGLRETLLPNAGQFVESILK